MSAPRFDKIGYWSEVKLDIVKKYAWAYSTILSRNAAHPPGLPCPVLPRSPRPQPRPPLWVSTWPSPKWQSCPSSPRIRSTDSPRRERYPGSRLVAHGASAVGTPASGRPSRFARLAVGTGHDDHIREDSLKVSTILHHIDGNSMALPELQRGYVWNRDQVCGLMDSLCRRHPVGGLFVRVTGAEGAQYRGDGTLAPWHRQVLAGRPATHDLAPWYRSWRGAEDKTEPATSDDGGQ